MLLLKSDYNLMSLLLNLSLKNRLDCKIYFKTCLIFSNYFARKISKLKKKCLLTLRFLCIYAVQTPGDLNNVINYSGPRQWICFLSPKSKRGLLKQPCLISLGIYANPGYSVPHREIVRSSHKMELSLIVVK